MKVQVRFDPRDLSTLKVFRNDGFVEIAAPFRITSHTHTKALPRSKDKKHLHLTTSQRLLQSSMKKRTETAETEMARTLGDEQLEGRFTLKGWTSFIKETLGHPLSEAETAELTTFFKRYAPLRIQSVSEALKTVVDLKGRDRHLSYYLGEISQRLLGGMK